MSSIYVSNDAIQSATGKANVPQCAQTSCGIFVYGHPNDYGL